jgi:hypothetical protein
MREQGRYSTWGLLTLVGGWIWLATGQSLGWIAWAPVGLVGGLCLSAGFGQLLWPGDRRMTQVGAAAGLLGMLLSVPYILVVGLGSAFTLFLGGLAAGFGSGRVAFDLELPFEGVPAPQRSASIVSKVALDEAILGFEQFQSSGFRLDGTIERVIAEVRETYGRFDRAGLLEKPENFHQIPPDLVDPKIRKQTVRGHSVEFLTFESGYAPAEDAPGRDRWLGYAPCRQGVAYVLRHPGPPRPWMICTNGYRMGYARMDVGLFERFYASQGLNVLIPVLPLHGPRKLGRHSGTGFLGIDVIDTLHAESQAIWDMRRLLSWVRAQDAPSVGAFGLSLGGYTTALFASVADGLDAVVAGIPLTDIARVVRRHGLPHQVLYAERLGYDPEQIRSVLSVVSPLVLEPKVAHANRMIFGATADRLVTPDHVRDLWRHWDEPEIVWYQGSHISFMNERDVWSGVDRTLLDAGVSVPTATLA